MIISGELLAKLIDYLYLNDDEMYEEMVNNDLWCRKYIGDAGFEFNDTPICMPLLDKTGKDLDYKTIDPAKMWDVMCEYYGRENIENYFSKLLAFLRSQGPDVAEYYSEEKDEYFEAYSPSNKKPIYEDSTWEIYRLSNLSDVSDIIGLDRAQELEVDRAPQDIEDFLILKEGDEYDSDLEFYSKGENFIFINLDTFWAWGYENGHMHPEDVNMLIGDIDTRNFLESLYRDHFYKQWDNKVVKIPLKKLQDGIVYNDYSLRYRNGYNGSLIWDSLTNADIVDSSYLIEYGLNDNLLESISKDNFARMSEIFHDDINENNISEKVEEFDDLYRAIMNAYIQASDNYTKEVMYNHIVKAIKECFPKSLWDKISIDEDELIITNPTAKEFDDVFDEYEQLMEPSKYLDELFNEELAEIIDETLRMNLKVTELSDYELYDLNTDEFNDCLEAQLDSL